MSKFFLYLSKSQNDDSDFSFLNEDINYYIDDVGKVSLRMELISNQPATDELENITDVESFYKQIIKYHEIGTEGFILNDFKIYSLDEFINVINDINEKVNNVYKGTANYAKVDGQAVDYSYWVYQISQVFLHYPNIKFRVINHKDWRMPDSWGQPNVTFTNIDDLVT